MCDGQIVIACMLSERAYPAKPMGYEVGAMRRAFRPFVGTPRDLARKVGAGHAFMCCEAEGGVDSSSWRSQQIFALDFDNKAGDRMTALDAAARLRLHGLAPAFAYETYSSTADAPRFRMTIALDEAYSDPAEAGEAIAALLWLFPEADQACRDLARMFYGSGSRAVWATGIVSPKGALDALVDEARAERDAVAAASARPARRARAPHEGDIDLEALKASADLLGMAAAETDRAPRESGGIVYFHGRCPVCGHRDCFRIWPDTNTWRCFSESNRGIDHGSAIDYVMATRGLPDDAGGISAAIDILRR
jgi:hypothetical protein